jgi:hypothetical protein
VNRRQRRARGPAAFYDPDAAAQHLVVSDSKQVARPAKLPPLSHAETRERFAQTLVQAGVPREQADAIALRTSANVCRKEGFKL